jgi:hypothetical protein
MLTRRQSAFGLGCVRYGARELGAIIQQTHGHGMSQKARNVAVLSCRFLATIG